MRVLRIVSVMLIVWLALPAARGVAGESGDKGNVAAQVEELQGRMMNDPEIMALIVSLRDDPEIKALLDDPKVAEALSAGNLDLLTSDPRFRKLLANPRVREIERKVGE